MKKLFYILLLIPLIAYAADVETLFPNVIYSPDGARKANVDTVTGKNRLAVEGPVQLQDGSGNTISSTSGSLNVNVTSPTGGSDTYSTGSFTGAGQTLTVAVNGQNSAMAKISGTWVGTIGFLVSIDQGVNFYSVKAMYQAGVFTPLTATNSSGEYLIPIGGVTHVRLSMTAYTSGTANVSLNVSVGTQPSYIRMQDTSGNSFAIGQTTMASSLPVAIASNQSGINTDLDKNGSDTITALNDTVVMTVNGASSIYVNVTGTWVATLSLEAEAGDGVWVGTLGLIPLQTINSVFFGNGSITIPCGGYSSVRVRASAYTSGTATVRWNASSGSNVAQVVNFTATALNAQVVGNLGATATDSGNPVKIGAVANSSLPTYTAGWRTDAQADLNGRLRVTNTPLDGSKATYSASITGLAAAATATDIFTITGSATKTIRVTKLKATATQTTTLHNNIVLLKRSTANSGGTSTTPTVVPYDSNSAAGTAVVRAYTVNPTLGTLVGNIAVEKVHVPAASSVAPNVGFDVDYGSRPSQAIVLRGTSQVLALNQNATTMTGNSWNIYVEWTEE